MNHQLRKVTIEDYDTIYGLWMSDEFSKRALNPVEEALEDEGIHKVLGLVFKDNERANAFWESNGYSLRTNLNYRNKSMSVEISAGE